MTSNTRDLLLEIGVEELPARFGPPALDQLAAKAASALAAARLVHGEIETYGTPRRLALLVRDVASAQGDRDVLVKGPAARMAYDTTGAPTRAALGFARARGVAVEALVVLDDEKGAPYVYVRTRETGQDADAILPDLLRDLVYALEFPRSMRWGAHTLRFARPIRWLLCLHGDRRVPFEVEGVVTTTETYGHRTLSSGAPIPVTAARDYVDVCAAAGVIVDPNARRAKIRRQVDVVAEGLGGRAPDDDGLLEEVTWLVEWPTAFDGRFDPAFLELPEDVLVTSMRTHQRYFPVYARADGRLLPAFIAVRNGGDASLDNVRHGNEKVPRARLSDARFFWDEDRRRRLDDRLDGLKQMVFQERLGSQYLRTERIVWLAEHIAGMLGYDVATRAAIARTAWLCKCDLSTGLVGEFPELQGAMGRAYARAQGEEEPVSIGIFEHYLPRGAGDALPESPTGVAVGLADRLNTLAGFFGLGLTPRGSADPFALRRAAQGVTAIIVEHRLRLSLDALLDAALAGYARFDEATRADTKDDLLQFFHARLEGAMRERGLRYDVAEAVLAVGYDDMADAVARAAALAHGLRTPAFASVTGAFKRIVNIAAKAEPAGAGEDSVVGTDGGALEPAEAALWQAFLAVRADAEHALASEDYARFYHLVAALKGPVDAFFAQALIMDPDPAVRRRRLAMLRDLTALLTRPADLGKLAMG